MCTEQTEMTKNPKKPNAISFSANNPICPLHNKA